MRTFSACAGWAAFRAPDIIVISARTRSAREDADLRDLIQRAALTNRHYGYRRIAQELRRQGLIVNAKRVLRLMREDNLLGLRAKPFVPRTTMSDHGSPDPAQSCAPAEADRPRPDLGRRHHLCPARRGLRLSGGRHRRVLAQSGGLGARQPSGGVARAASARPGAGRREIPRPTASFIIPIAGCNMRAATISSGSRPAKSPSA